MRDPKKLLVQSDQGSFLHGVSHFKIQVENEEWKTQILIDLFDSLDYDQAIIICNSKSRVLDLFK